MLPRFSEDDILPENPPEWFSDMNPRMRRAEEIARRLIEEEGYSEEQAYEIALERLPVEDADAAAGSDLLATDEGVDITGTPV